MENKENFELALIALVVEKLDERQISHAAFGKFIFGETSGSRIWRVCRLNERDRDITVNEVVKIAYFFGKNLPDFIQEIYQSAVDKGLFVPLTTLSPEMLLIDAVKKLLAEKNIRPSSFYKEIFGKNAEEIWSDYANNNFKRPLTFTETRRIADFFKMSYSEFMEYANQ